MQHKENPVGGLVWVAVAAGAVAAAVALWPRKKAKAAESDTTSSTGTACRPASLIGAYSAKQKAPVFYLTQLPAHQASIAQGQLAYLAAPGECRIYIMWNGKWEINDEATKDLEKWLTENGYVAG